MIKYTSKLQKERLIVSKLIQKSSRLLWADILKFWGIFAIVWGHTLSDGTVHQYLYSFHVPLFFFVIGLYFKPPRISFCRFLQKKAYSLIVPYFIFAVISVLVFSVLGSIAASALSSDVADFSLSANLLEILIGQCRANRPLWFLPCMFIFYILCFGLTKFTEKLSTPVRITVFIIVIAISVALCALNSVVKIDSLFWKVDVAIFMLCFFVIAILVKPFLMQRISTFSFALLTILFLLFGGILAFQNSTIAYLSNNYGNIWLFYSGSVCTILGFCCLSIVISRLNVQVINKALTYVGQRTLPILLMHKFPILFFQVIFPWTKQPLKNNNAYVSLAVAIVSIAGCLIVDLIWQKIFNVVMSKIRRNKQATK